MDSESMREIRCFLGASEVLGVFVHELLDGAVDVLAFIGDFLLALQWNPPRSQDPLLECGSPCPVMGAVEVGTRRLRNRRQ